MSKRREMLDLVIGLVLEVQAELSGRQVDVDVNEDTVPIGDLSGFDSLNGIELTTMLPTKLGWLGQNLCVSEDGKRALTIGEMADRLLQEEESK